MPIAPITTYTTKNRLDYLFPDIPHPEINVALVTGTYAMGTLLGEVIATPGTYKPYASASTDGSQNPALILMYACVVDANGNVTLGTTAGAGEQGQFFGKAAPAYMGGSFRCQELVGLDANAITKLAARIIQGTIASGIVVF